MLGITIYSTGGTQDYIEKLGVKCIPVETLTSYPSILDGRVKTLHPSIFGGILGKRNNEAHVAEMREFKIPEIDLVIVDLYPFEETVKSTTDETLIIEKIDIGGPSMIRAAAKNHHDVVVIAAKKDYILLEEILEQQKGETSLEQRRMFAIKAFDVCTGYDNAISNYFHGLAFESEVARLMEWVKTHLSPTQHDSTAFGVFRPGKNAALGICEIVIQRKSARSKWVKMLRLHLSPAVDSGLQAGDSDDAMNVFKSSILGSMSLQMSHQATTMKVFGRTNDQLNFLKAVVGSLQVFLKTKPNNQVKVSIEGRFLTIAA